MRHILSTGTILQTSAVESFLNVPDIVFMFARTMPTPKHIQKDYEAFLEDILRRLLQMQNGGL